MKKFGVMKIRAVSAAICVVIAILAVCGSSALAADPIPEMRLWKTKDGKHTVEAELVQHSLADVTLKLKNGKTTTVKLSLMSTRDLDYLKGFPKLAGQADQKNLPWVRVKAKVKARKKTGTSKSLIETRSKSMEVDITNRSKQNLDLVVLYGFLVEDLTGKSSTQRRLTDIGLKGVRTKKVTIGGQKDFAFETGQMRTFEINSATKGGSKDQGFVVQIYWKGQLLDGWTGDSNFRDLAKDSTLLEKIGGG